jgi:proline iminopeptidase
MSASAASDSHLTEHGIFADVRGRADSPALLVLHGGPGQGCYDFMAMQGDRLATELRVVGLDQRGVDRSVPLPEGASVSVADLVADCEAVRQALGIARWVVYGQSFGGMLALRYATAHPEVVSAVVFENPAWDVAASARESLLAVADLLAAGGRDAAADEARTAAAGDLTPPEVFARYMAAVNALEDDRAVYFYPSQAARDRLEVLWADRARQAAEAGEPEADYESTLRHHLAILADDDFYESVLPLLAGLRMPSLLIVGGLDHVASAEQRAAFRAALPDAAVREFPACGHFAHVQEPDLFAAAVLEFARGR